VARKRHFSLSLNFTSTPGEASTPFASKGVGVEPGFALNYVASRHNLLNPNPFCDDKTVPKLRALEGTTV